MKAAIYGRVSTIARVRMLIFSLEIFGTTLRQEDGISSKNMSIMEYRAAKISVLHSIN